MQIYNVGLVSKREHDSLDRIKQDIKNCREVDACSESELGHLSTISQRARFKGKRTSTERGTQCPKRNIGQ
jgi:hypothetical protein